MLMQGRWLKPQLFFQYKVPYGIRRLRTLQQPSSSDQLKQSEIELINLFLPFARRQTKTYISSRYGLRITEKFGNNVVTPIEPAVVAGVDVGKLGLGLGSSTEAERSLKAVLRSNDYDFNQTILQFVDFNSRYMFKNPVVDQLIEFIIGNTWLRDGKPLGLNKTSYTFLIYYASNHGSVNQVLKLFTIMISVGKIRPTTTIFNYAMMTDGDSDDLSVTLRFVDGIIKQNLDCDQNTWYILFNKIHNSDLKEILIHEMIKLKLDLNPIFASILKWRMEVSVGSSNDAYEWMVNKGIDLNAPTYGYLFNSVSILDAFLGVKLDSVVVDDYSVYSEMAQNPDSKNFFDLQDQLLDCDADGDPNGNLVKVLGSDLRYDSLAADRIEKYVMGLLVNKADQLNQNSWELVIHFFLRKYRFKSAHEIIKKYGEQGQNLFEINTKIINWILWYSLNCKRVSGKYFGVKVFAYLKENSKEIKTDVSTWKILMNFIKQENNDKQFELIERMKDLNFKTAGMILYAATAKYKQCNDANLVIDWLYDNELIFEEHLPPRAATFLVSRLLENYEYENAVKFINKQRLLQPQTVIAFLSYFKKTDQFLKGSIFWKLCAEKKLFNPSVLSDKYSNFKNVRLTKFDETSNRLKDELIEEFLWLKGDLTESKVLTTLLLLSESTGIVSDSSVFENEILEQKVKFELPDSLRLTVAASPEPENDNKLIEELLGNSVWYDESDYVLISKYIKKLDFLKLSDSSITKIIRFLSYKYQYGTILELLDEMELNNRQPTTKALNYALYATFSSTGRIFDRRNAVAVSILEIFSKNNIPPDWTTWFIIFKSLTDSLVANKMLSLMIEKSIDPGLVLSSAFLFKHNELKNVEETINWFHLNNLFQSEIRFHGFVFTSLFSCYLQENRPLDAIRLIFNLNPKLHFSLDKTKELIDYYLKKRNDIVGAYLILELYEKVHHYSFNRGLDKLKQFCQNNYKLNDALHAMINKSETDSGLLSEYEVNFLSKVYRIRENEVIESLGFNENKVIVEEAIDILKNEDPLRNSDFYKSLCSYRNYHEDIGIDPEQWDDHNCNELIGLLRPESRNYSRKLTSQLVTHFKKIDVENYNQTSLNDLSLFLARSGYFIELSKLVDKLKVSDYFEVTPFMMNSILYKDMRRNNLRDLVIHLKEFINDGIRTDVSTWFIVLDALNSNNDVASCLVDKGIDPQERLGINPRITKALTKDDVDSSLIINGPTETYKMITNTTESKTLNKEILVSFIDYFMDQSQVYYAIALINYNNSHSGKLPDWRMYEFVLEKFIKLDDDFTNYNNILYRLCQLANPNNSEEFVETINTKLEERGIDLKPIQDEVDVVNQVNEAMFHLNWSNKPQFELHKNDENFVRSASYFGLHKLEIVGGN